MKAIEAFRVGGGLRVERFFWFAGTWYRVRKGAVPLVRVQDAAESGALTERHRGALSAHFRLLLAQEAPVVKTAPVLGAAPPKPELGLKNFGGTVRQMRRTMERMGKV